MTDTPARLDGRRFYHPELDILRFFAFLLVFVHHSVPHDAPFWTAYGIPNFIAGMIGGIGATGAFGVDVFFALSAYLITELLLREKALIGDLDLKSFYARRVLRVWPLYFFFLALAGALTFIIPGQRIGWRATLAFLFLSGNWWIVLRGFPSSVIFPLWSVSIEEQFYLCWPPLVRRLQARHMSVVACVMLAIAWVARWYAVGNGAGETQIWCNTFARLDPIAAGILVSVLLRGETPEFSKWVRVGLIAVGLACLVLAGSYWAIKADPLTTMRVLAGYPAVALGAVALLLGLLRDSGSESSQLAAIESRGLSLGNVLVYLGRISYGLYVYHVLALMLSDFVVPNADANLLRYVARVAIALSLTIALSAISFHWLERPFLGLKQRFTHVPSRPGG